MLWRMLSILFGERMFVNPNDRYKLMAIQTQLNVWLEIMQEDPHFAAPEFMLEQIWNRLEKIISSSNLCEVLESL